MISEIIKTTAESVFNLTFIRNVAGIINRKAGETIQYRAWNQNWQNMSPKEREEKGIYVICYGMGEFEVLIEGEDVVKEKRQNRSKLSRQKRKLAMYYAKTKGIELWKAFRCVCDIYDESKTNPELKRELDAIFAKIS